MEAGSEVNLSSAEDEDTVQNMENQIADLKISDKFKRNNLELYLEDVFKDQVVFQIEQDEVEFIEKAIERLVAELADKIIEQGNENIESNQCSDRRHIQNVTGIHLIEKDNGDRILKAGSYYEKTKNTFPDEFDFILILKTFEVHEECQGNFYQSALPFILIGMHPLIADILRKEEKFLENLQLEQTGPKGERKIMFDKIKRIAGPSLKLEFSYYNYDKQETKIDVDFVPAYQVIDKNAERIKAICRLPEFTQVLARFSRYYFVLDDITFTEAEVYFMRNILSAKHVKAYRLVKFLINGHTDGAELEEECKQEEVIYVHIPTYRIKMILIYHHYNCSYSDDEDLSSCVLQLISTIDLFYNNHPWPRLVEKLNIPYIGKKVNAEKRKKYHEVGTHVLKTIQDSLLSLQTSTKPYVSKDICIPSFARSLVNEMRNCEWTDNPDQYLWYGCYGTAEMYLLHGS